MKAKSNIVSFISPIAAYESSLKGLKINISKTKVMTEDDTPMYVNTNQIEKVKNYVYLGQNFSLKEINPRRITTGWAAYAKHHYIFKSNFAIWDDIDEFLKDIIWQLGLNIRADTSHPLNASLPSGRRLGQAKARTMRFMTDTFVPRAIKIMNILLVNLSTL